MNELEAILEFWFGETGADGAVDPAKRKMWFGAGRKHDAEIAQRFGAVHDRAARGELDEWAGTPRGRLALIVVLDQFSRHIHRDTAGAFAQDPAARRLALEGLERADDAALDPVQRAFCYLPLEHAEDSALQRQSVACFRRLRDCVGASHVALYDGFLDHALRHQAVIDRFGRFPHRNEALGRASTAEELAFLAQPGSRF